jgi:hypothetical protein
LAKSFRGAKWQRQGRKRAKSVTGNPCEYRRIASAAALPLTLRRLDCLALGRLTFGLKEPR